MKCKVDKGDLSAVLKHAVKVAPSKPSVDVLKCVRLVAADGRLTVEVTDLDVTLRLDVPCAGAEDGAACVDAKTLAAVVGKLPAGPLTLSMGAEGTHLAVEAESGARVDVVATDGAAFPELPEMPDGPGLDVDGGRLSALLGSVRHAVSSDQSRPNLCGVFFRVASGVLRAVATDGHRLSQAEVPAPEGADDWDGIIIPSSGMDRLVEHAHGGLTLRRADNALAVSIPGGSLHLRLLDAAFPDYRQVIPKGGAAVDVDVAEFRAGLGVAATLASERTHGVRIDFGADGRAALSSDNPDRGRARATVAFSGECPEEQGKPLTIACNVAYLEQALSTLDTPRASVQVSVALAPLVVRPLRADGDAGGVDALHVIMPMRL